MYYQVNTIASAMIWEFTQLFKDRTPRHDSERFGVEGGSPSPVVWFDGGKVASAARV